MNHFKTYEPLAASKVLPLALDVDWSPIPSSDEDLMKERRRLDAAFERTLRDQRAYDYIASVTQRINIKIKRLLLGAMTFFLWTVALVLLVGTWV